MIDKTQGLGEFIIGAVLALGGAAVVFWGTVSSNRSGIELLQEDVRELRSEVGEVKDDSEYTRARVDTLLEVILQDEDEP